jgi:hypothetical protein
LYYFDDNSSLVDVEDCIAGAEGRFEGTEPSLLFTVNAKTNIGQRIIVARVNNREERNTVLSKLRYDDFFTPHIGF